MNRNGVTRIALTVAFTILGQTLSAQSALPVIDEDEYFAVGVEQYGRSVPIQDHQAVLRKDPFTLVIAFHREDAILVGASFTPESFGPAQLEKSLEEIPVFTGTGMAEAPFNPDALLMINRSSPHYWHYAGDSEHRFTTVTRENNMILCRRFVSRFLYPESTAESVPVNRIAENTLYLVFMKTKWADDYSHQIELQRDYLKILFE